MTQTDSSMQQVIDRCRAARFTGIVRIHAKQGEGELWFLSGVTDESKFGVSVGDEAMARILGLTDMKVELVPRLPNEAGAMKKGLPIEGTLGPVRPVDLFRLCELHALTCTLELQSSSRLGEAKYEMGDLLSVECDDGTDRGVAEMLQWTEGTYKFILPTVELPPGIAPWVSASLAAAAPESIPAPPVKPTAEADAKARADEEKIRKKAEELAAKKKADEAEARRKAAEADAKRKAELDTTREGAEAKRKAEAEAKRLAAEADAKRRAAEGAEMKRRAEVVKRKADEAEAKRRVVSEKPASVGTPHTAGAAVAKAKSEPPRVESKPPRMESKPPRVESKPPRMESKPPRVESKPPGPAVVVQKIVEVVASPSQRPPPAEKKPEEKKPAEKKPAPEPEREAAPSPSPAAAKVEEPAGRELPGLVPEEDEGEEAARVSEPVPLSRRAKKKSERARKVTSDRPPAPEPVEEDEAPLVPPKKGPSVTTILLFLLAIAAAVYFFYLRRK